MRRLEPPTTLKYARDIRDWKRRARRSVLRLWLVLLVIGCVGYGGYRMVQRRIAILENNPMLNPIDWGTVLTSATLLDLAWNLSSRDFDVSRVGLFGLHEKVFDVELVHPLRYREGLLELTVSVTNSGTKKGVVPALRPSPRYAGDHLASVLIESGSYLSKGALVLDPGETVTIRIEVPAPEQPSAISVLFPNVLNVPNARLFGIGTQKFGFFEPLPYDSWDEVPASLITTPP